MLDPWIIEEIRRREQERDEQTRIPLELPLYREPEGTEASPPPVDPDRGIVIIETQ